ncbi:ABC transporter permease [Herpetosiphon giganteus]|uniref:ABC transporter permease n=1 Tax=Herpetosiphon giganteus TaxID=2029754 RepID=UPI00195CF077|nr:ABC transporter permease [Herpetosiphon giganteus]MBM7842874.1 simple sugar transport system permease protein [Herpetosiphon giganteus]
MANEQQAPAETKKTTEPQPSKRRFGWLNEAIVPLLAILTAVLIGAVIVFVSIPGNKLPTFDLNIYGSRSDWFFSTIPERLRVTLSAFTGLFSGAFGDWTKPSTIPVAISNTLVESTPYILAGLAVAVTFKAGLFNVGAEGQLLMGALGSVAVAAFMPQWFGVASLPAIIHLPAALLAGVIAGGLWGIIPGYLRAKTGAHEVITTIMLNYIALQVMDYLINGVMKDKSATLQRTPFIHENAALPRIISKATDPSLTGGQAYPRLFTTTSSTWDLRIHMGIVLAFLMVGFIWWLMNRTPKGFEIKTVGENPEAARYAGMSITGTVVGAMGLSGALAGLAGTSQVIGLEYNLKAVFSSGLGFDSLAIALLAKSNPIAIVPAALFWGALRTGAGAMQVNTGISINLIQIIQALVIMFIAADQIVRWIYRIKQAEGGKITFNRSWGK